LKRYGYQDHTVFWQKATVMVQINTYNVNFGIALIDTTITDRVCRKLLLSLTVLRPTSKLANESLLE
jgi:hypothetical protein